MLKTHIWIEKMKDCAKITKHRQIINSKFSNIAKNMCYGVRKGNFQRQVPIRITQKLCFFVQIFSVL